jgi:hypothetical protein
MAAIKISSKVEKEQWQALQSLAKESHQSILSKKQSPFTND